MTHGEAWYKNKCQLANCESLDLDDADTKVRIPARMGRSDAAAYYRVKLFHHWINDYSYDERVDERRKKEIVSTFMLGHPKHYEKYEELQDESI